MFDTIARHNLYEGARQQVGTFGNKLATFRTVCDAGIEFEFEYMINANMMNLNKFSSDK